MWVALFSATSETYRASSRAGESLSPPTFWRLLVFSGVVTVGIPSENNRTVNGSFSPLSPVSEPMMSLLSMPSMSMFCAFASWAKWAEPYRPSSSPATVMNLIVASNVCWDITRAISIIAATPEPSSSAPGASQVASIAPVQRES